MTDQSKCGIPVANLSAVRRTMSSPYNQPVRSSSSNRVSENVTQLTSSSRRLSQSFVQSRDDGCHWSLVSGSLDYLSAQHVTRRSKHTMVRYRNCLYIFGGDDGKRMLNDLMKLIARFCFNLESLQIL